MPQVTISRPQALAMLSLTKELGKDTFFLAKDHGAYVGQSNGTKKALVYFRGCNPAKDPAFYDNAHSAFGGDDFGCMLPIAWLQQIEDNPVIRKTQINVTARKVTCKHFR